MPIKPGCIRALYEICRDAGNLTPFQTLIGLSAGAVNASFLAAEANDLDYATDRLCAIWKLLQVKDVMRVDPFSITKTAVKLARQVTLGGFSSWLRGDRMSLLNTAPLAQLLRERVRFDNIQRNIEEKKLHALCVTATDYSTSLGVTFFSGNLEIEPWTRVQRMGRRAVIGVDHVMGSSAIPIFFPPWPIGDRFFGDGCLRNTAPLSPGIHCGASKLIVLGSKAWKPVDLTPDTNLKPSLGRVLSVLINAILMDGIETDVERIRIINKATATPSRPGERATISGRSRCFSRTRRDDLRHCRGLRGSPPARFALLDGRPRQPDGVSRNPELSHVCTRILHGPRGYGLQRYSSPTSKSYRIPDKVAAELPFRRDFSTMAEPMINPDAPFSKSRAWRSEI